MHLEGIGNMEMSKETDSPEKMAQFKRLTSAAKSNGSLIIAQINHCGRQTPSNVNPAPYSSSDVQLTVRIKTSFGKPVALTTEQIKTEIVDRFVYTAVKCYEAGFDGVEVNINTLQTINIYFSYMLHMDTYLLNFFLQLPTKERINMAETQTIAQELLKRFTKAFGKLHIF
jgi:hypothetical protein